MEEPADESRGVEGGASKLTRRIVEETKRRSSGGKDAKATDGREKTVQKEKGVEEKGVKVKVEDGRKATDGTKRTKPKEGKSGAIIDKARLWKLLNDDCDSDTSSEEGLRGKTWHGRSREELRGKQESGKSRGEPSREIRSKDVGLKDVRTKESKTKDAKPNGKGHRHRHRHSSSATRTKHSSKSGRKSSLLTTQKSLKSSKPEARSGSSGRVRQSRNNVEADSSTDPKGNGKSVNTDIWEGIPSAARLLSQEPGPVVVPPFEATRLNDDIWAAVHREMVEVAEVLKSTNKNKGDNEEPSSSTARNGSVPRRPYGVGH